MTNDPRDAASEATLENERFGAARVRADFIAYFAERGHRHVPSSPVFPADDPTLLFTNAGMNQFKDVFLGTGERAYSRAVNSQKCLRVSGKHNDLEEVGRDTYHHTFFEMLGNWSFGDYFKEEAIPWAWELLTEVWGLDPRRLWVTVFEGDEADGLGPDEESERIWCEMTGIDPARVLRFDRSDNFWEMGETGPCGPCTEIHIDRGGPESDPADGADRAIGVNAGNERFMELWNLVFMQFNRRDDGSLVELPARHVDTGLGFERILAVLQGKGSNYDTDLFAPLFESIGARVGRSYPTGDEETDVAFRVLADHARAVSAALADGVLPSNTGRGYVLRRLIRRAARFARQTLELEEPILCEVSSAVGVVLGDAFGEIRSRSEHLALVIREEEEAFGRTLGRGLVRFAQLAERVAETGERTLPGADAFDLYSTYGFPRDLVELMARERELELDAEGWEAAHQTHRAASRAEGTFRQLLSAEELETLPATHSTVHPDEADAEADAESGGVESETRLVALLRGGEGRRDRLVLEGSPFYAEAGGQVGDRGVVCDVEGGFEFTVEDTQKIGGVVVHLGSAVGEAGPGAALRARVDGERRARIRRNHTATHLLHGALQRVLGDHVTQQGSHVGPDGLRFDFSNPGGLEPEEIERVEALVNERVCENDPVDTTVEDLEAAKARGVVALFGEKYDDRVRVVDVGGWSTELCGGTHVGAAGEIGPFVILTERAIQAGVRRIEAVTGSAAVEQMQRQRRLLADCARKVKVAPEELGARIEAMQEKLKQARMQRKASSGDELRTAFEHLEGVLGGRLDGGGIASGAFDLPALDGRGLSDLADRLGGRFDELALVLAGRDGERVPFLVTCSPAALEAGLAAGDLARELGGRLGGGGGGRPERAQGQGNQAAALPEALEWAREAIESGLRG
ncbi:MAG: alanine--tRNA ligase [Planctomycetota bacterium]|jgi:alanyl-tRNA synthetase|nr:alanine--tRNA ligase [Planctomycetota bacterium]